MALYPLESNPDVLNKFIHSLGVPHKFNIVDVYGLDEDALAYVPQPVYALVLLFPYNDKYNEFAKQEKAEIDSKGQVVSPNVFFMKQYISNACGTIALLHCIANNMERMDLEDGELKRLIQKFQGKSPEERGKLLSDSSENSEALKIITAHQELAMEGQTELNPTEQVNHHFIAIIEKDGKLYELDGRKDYPIVHGETTTDNFLKDAAKVCKRFMERDAEDINFTVLALCTTES